MPAACSGIDSIPLGTQSQRTGFPGIRLAAQCSRTPKGESRKTALTGAAKRYRPGTTCRKLLSRAAATKSPAKFLQEGPDAAVATFFEIDRKPAGLKHPCRGAIFIEGCCNNTRDGLQEYRIRYIYSFPRSWTDSVYSHQSKKAYGYA
jgi:hypothetical protein